MTVTIIGENGFIGTRRIKLLLDSGYTVKLQTKKIIL